MIENKGMKLKFIIITLLLLIQISCDNSEKRPGNIITEDNMVLILIDVQILEATYNTRLIHLEDRNERMERYYQEIFEKHQTSIEIFNESYTYYEKNPLELDAIYEDVLEKLEAMQTEEESKLAKAKAKKKAAKEEKKRKARERAKKISK